MTSEIEITKLDGLSQAELIKKGEITAAELLEAVIARIEAINPQLNAVVMPMYEQARQMAEQDHSESIFAGIPFLLKDLGTMYAGARLSGGSAALADFYPTVDSSVVIRMKKAGLNIAGKTNTPEFGLLPTTESHFLGTCRNPWQLSRIPGGSSGGAAAAVAAGIVPLAHASDGGGSIRIPASCCGLFGLKPTRARISRSPSMGDSISGLSTDGCISRTVRDSAAFLDAVAGPELGDPYWAPPQTAPYLSEIGKSPGKLRIAYATVAPSGVPIHPECVAATEATAQLCASLGHQVEKASPQIDGQQFNDTFVAMWTAGCSWTLNSIARLKQSPPNPDEYEPLTWALYEMGQNMTSGQYLLAVQWMQQLSRQVAHFFTEYDLWLTPTLAEPPLPLGSFERKGEPLYALQRGISFVPFTPLANATGQPAMSVPLHWTADNLPVGSHFCARFGDEATLFRLAAQLERARPWVDRRPALP